MPKFLEHFLKSLTPQQAEEIVAWFDADRDSDLADDMSPQFLEHHDADILSEIRDFVFENHTITGRS
jgi:hypothetical protein